MTVGQSTALVVDDESSFRKLCRRMLEPLGMRVLEAEDGEQAKAILFSFQGISLLITDVQMPRLMGPFLVQDIHPQHPDLRILYISGDGDGHPIVKKHMAEWNCRFLAKPFAPTAFVGMVQELLASPQRASAEVRAPDDRRAFRAPACVSRSWRPEAQLEDLRSSVNRMELLRLERDHVWRRLKTGGGWLAGLCLQARRIGAATDWECLLAEDLR